MVWAVPVDLYMDDATPVDEEDPMRDIHPDVKSVLDSFRELRNRIADINDKVEGIVARRPSPSGFVIPEVDAFGRLRDLYLAPGTCLRFGSDELVREIMAAVSESVADARRQHHFMVNDRQSLARPLAEVIRERRGDRGAERNAARDGNEEQ